MGDLKTYFLFGSCAVKVYNNESDFQKVLEELKDCDYATYLYDEKVDMVTDFAEAMNGWGDYALLTKKEYELIEALTDPYSFEDLSERPGRYPVAIREVVNRVDQLYEDGTLDSKDLQKAVEACELFGWTFEYGLDLVPYNLSRKGGVA